MQLGGKIPEMMLKRKRELYPQTFSAQEQFIENIQALQLNNSFRIWNNKLILYLERE